MTAPIIETPRLILRSWRDEDVDAWADMNADPRVMEFFVEPTPRKQSYEQAALIRSDLERNGYGWFVMEVKGESGFAGVIAIDHVHGAMPFTPLLEIGWRLPFERWGRGYATEGAAALMRYAFDTLQWPEIVSFTAAINERSQNVMRKLGMTRDSGEDFDHPRVPDGHRLKRHVLYRAKASGNGA